MSVTTEYILTHFDVLSFRESFTEKSKSSRKVWREPLFLNFFFLDLPKINKRNRHHKTKQFITQYITYHLNPSQHLMSFTVYTISNTKIQTSCLVSPWLYFDIYKIDVVNERRRFVLIRITFDLFDYVSTTLRHVLYPGIHGSPLKSSKLRRSVCNEN